MKKKLITPLLITLISCNINTQPTHSPFEITTEKAVNKTIHKKQKLIDYTCDNYANITVSFTSVGNNNDRVNIVIINTPNAQPITLAGQTVDSGFLYSNGKYTLRGKGSDVQWTVGKMMPIKCTAAERQSTTKL